MKKILIFLGVIVVILSGLIIGYNLNLSSVSKKSEAVAFVIDSGTSTKKVVANLKKANLIKSESVALIYIKLHKVPIKAGKYDLNRNMDLKAILALLENGGIADNTFKITFKEGNTLETFVKQIAEASKKSYDELIKEINDPEFIKPLIAKYWFLDEELLNKSVYYYLEGYLYPNTYEFYKDASLNDMVTKMLDETGRILDSYQDKINSSGYSVHDILTIASIIEKEAVKESDRGKVSQVIYKRLATNMSLGMDVTAYYGARKSMTESITKAELNDSNPYNTRLTSFLGLPVGAICNPSRSSINAALYPSDTDYVYFFADIKTGEVHFTDNFNEFQTFKEIYG